MDTAGATANTTTNSVDKQNQTHAATHNICGLCVPRRRCTVVPLMLRLKRESKLQALSCVLTTTKGNRRASRELGMCWVHIHTGEIHVMSSTIYCHVSQVALSMDTAGASANNAKGNRRGMGVFLLLQQRSEHPREMVITPKASTSHLENRGCVGFTFTRERYTWGGARQIKYLLPHRISSFVLRPWTQQAR